MRDFGLLLAFVEFQGSSGQVSDLAPHAPDYLMLSDTMLKSVTASSQPLRRLEQVLATCRQLGIKAVLPPCDCQRTIGSLPDLGYEYAVQTTPNETADRRNAVAIAG